MNSLMKKPSKTTQPQKWNKPKNEDECKNKDDIYDVEEGTVYYMEKKLYGSHLDSHSPIELTPEIVSAF